MKKLSFFALCALLTVSGIRAMEKTIDPETGKKTIVLNATTAVTGVRSKGSTIEQLKRQATEPATLEEIEQLEKASEEFDTSLKANTADFKAALAENPDKIVTKGTTSFTGFSQTFDLSSILGHKE